MVDLDRFELEDLYEGRDLEFKKAAGRDGRGEVPNSFWDTYSAMANTHGGEIILGIEELPSGKLSANGIQDIAKVRRTLFDGQSNRQIISRDLLTDDRVQEVDLRGVKVLSIRIPRAKRSERPVYVGSNPLIGTFRRNNEGDYRCDEATVRRMLAEQLEESPDSKLLPGFGVSDLEPSTLATYRTQLKATKADHPWNDLEEVEFLRCIGGWRRDRISGDEGLTIAGLLMFGKLRPILDALPYYCVDYQERPESRTEARWIDRITTDGTWSGNLFDFYRKVMPRLLSDLKIPFHMEGDRRVDETQIHQALREALINTLIHADYSGRVSILVVKRPDLFGFRNPGLMRVPLEEAVVGGVSDCRNRGLQKMFQLVGLAEQAGSGIPKIYHSWKQQSWRKPEFEEKVEPEQTLLYMHTLSLLPDKTLAKLDARFGTRFRSLSESQRLALVEVELEGSISHSRLREISSGHARDLTLALQALVREGFLASDGGGKKSRYFFPVQDPEASLLGTPDDARSSQHLNRASGENEVNSKALTSTSQHLPGSSQHLGAGGAYTEEENRLLDSLPATFKPVLISLRQMGKAPKTAIRDAILQLCGFRPFTLKELASLLSRAPLTLQNHHLSELVREGRLVLMYPDKPSHPDQAYRSAAGRNEGNVA